MNRKQNFSIVILTSLKIKQYGREKSHLLRLLVRRFNFGRTAFYCEEESEIQASHSQIKSNDQDKPIFMILSEAKLTLSDIQINSAREIDFRHELTNASYFKIENSTLNDLCFLDYEKKVDEAKK